MLNQKRIVALDVGSKSCGIAISDPFRWFANPLENFFFPEKDFIYLINHLEWLFSDYEIARVIIGYPLRMTNTKSPTTYMIEDFVELFKERFDYEVVLVDERLSTQKAFGALRLANLSHSKAKTKKDVMAAVILLNEHLNNLG